MSYGAADSRYGRGGLPPEGSADWESEGWAAIVDSMLHGGSTQDMGASTLLGAPAWGPLNETGPLFALPSGQQPPLKQPPLKHQGQHQGYQQEQPYDGFLGGADAENCANPFDTRRLSDQRTLPSLCCSDPKPRKRQLRVRCTERGKRRRKRRGASDSEDSDWRPQRSPSADSASAGSPSSPSATACADASQTRRNSSMAPSCPSSSSSAAAARGEELRLENAALNDYDMCEISVEWHLPELPETAERQKGLVPIRRVFGINAGMTLFNLHRIICISLGLDEEVQILSVLRNKTKQNALIWVPRCVAAGSYGTAPGSDINWNSPDEVSQHVPTLEIDVKTINLGFIETRFSKNTSISRRTKMIRAECYSESIHDFWRDSARVRQLAIRVSRQTSHGRRCLDAPSKPKQLLMHTQPLPQEAYGDLATTVAGVPWSLRDAMLLQGTLQQQLLQQEQQQQQLLGLNDLLLRSEDFFLQQQQQHEQLSLLLQQEGLTAEEATLFIEQQLLQQEQQQLQHDQQPLQIFPLLDSADCASRFESTAPLAAPGQAARAEGTPLPPLVRVMACGGFAP
ncbi:uncharacterized protein LOC34621313 [Cyclospora cayetanensis]|uniref:Uncharacterized protein LOC34621313 n=1 Tax=Cyclospora cayetanensis TaxID=88456 RepID=A0A6P6S1U2_9EIME|nr:uncharacterized protein LOC34621313 [Cyclospora cayetanensis]